MIRIAICICLALAYGAYRLWPAASAVVVTPSVAVPFEAIGSLSASIAADDKVALREAYLILSRSIAADPSSDPVFLDTAAVRRAHRAALLTVWAGVLANKAGEVPGLREALESAINARIGTADIPMNPTLKADASKAFADIAASIR